MTSITGTLLNLKIVSLLVSAERFLVAYSCSHPYRGGGYMAGRACSPYVAMLMSTEYGAFPLFQTFVAIRRHAHCHGDQTSRIGFVATRFWLRKPDPRSPCASPPSSDLGSARNRLRLPLVVDPASAPRLTHALFGKREPTTVFPQQS